MTGRKAAQRPVAPKARFGRVIDSPHLPEGEAVVSVTEEGIRD